MLWTCATVIKHASLSPLTLVITFSKYVAKDTFEVKNAQGQQIYFATERKHNEFE